MDERLQGARGLSLPLVSLPPHLYPPSARVLTVIDMATEDVNIRSLWLQLLFCNGGDAPEGEVKTSEG